MWSRRTLSMVGGHENYMLRRRATQRPSGMVQRSQLFASQQADGRECVKARKARMQAEGRRRQHCMGMAVAHGKRRMVPPSQDITTEQRQSVFDPLPLRWDCLRCGEGGSG